MRTKVATWPAVLPDDDGIRPAGAPDECFYCQQKVGQPHKPDCVTVTKNVLYDVLMDDKKVGTLLWPEPHGWSPEQCEFVRNESSWCADNAINSIKWTDPEAEKTIAALGEWECSCSRLGFRFVRVEDCGPFVQLKEVTCPRTPS